MNELIKMSFMKGTLDIEKAKELVSKTNKIIKYTHGLGYRNPTTHLKPIGKEEAYNIIKNESWLDITEHEDYIHLNSFSGNDMW